MSILVALLFIFSVAVKSEKFLLYCSCAGRIGNQLDRLLGTIEFAQTINYTLVLTPFVHYPVAAKGNIKLTFYEEVFNVDTFVNPNTYEVKPYRAITWTQFVQRRQGNLSMELICVSDNIGYKRNVLSCELPDYLPYNAYWKLLGVTFAGRGKFESMDALIGTESHEDLVLALLKQPGVSPAKQHQQKYQAYLAWSAQLTKQMSSVIPKKPYLAVHIRIAQDMKTACSGIESSPSLFAFEQCKFHEIEPIKENCVPSIVTIYRNIERILHNDDLAAVYLATDSYMLVAQELLPLLKLNFPGVDFLLDKKATEFGDLFLMEQSDVFLGSCVSTYSAFVARHRFLRKKRVEFIQVPNNLNDINHSEL